MKGPHFFEKRKKEMARQEKLKQKADRKAQRKAGKGKDGDEPSDEFSDIEGLNSGLQADGADADGEQLEEGQPPVDGQATPEHQPAGASDDQVRGS